MPFLSGMPGLTAMSGQQPTVGQPGINPSAIQFMDLMANMPGGSPFGGNVPNFGTPFAYGVPQMLPETFKRPAVSSMPRQFGGKLGGIGDTGGRSMVGSEA